MGKKAVDIDKLIAVARGIPGLGPVADLAQIGQRVCGVIRESGGLPRVRKAKAESKPRMVRRPPTIPGRMDDVGGSGGTA